jgi:hypothetical protein
LDPNFLRGVGGGTGVRTQGFALANQVLSYLSQTSGGSKLLEANKNILKIIKYSKKKT